MTDTATTPVGVEGVAGGFGLVGGGPVDLAGVLGGPFVVSTVTDDDGSVAAVVAVTDSDTLFPGGPEPVLDALAAAAGVETGGTVSGVDPVGSPAELAGLFTLPTTTVVYTTASGDTGAVYVTTTDRRNPQPQPGPPAGIPGISTTPTTTTTTGGGGGGVHANAGGLDKLVNVALQVSVELGRTRVTLSEVLDYDVGSIIELDRAAGAPVDIRVNDTLLAQGEVVLIDDEYAVRITAIIEPHQT